jgi:probable rRNA maturation factor
MVVAVVNAQRAIPVNMSRMAQVARWAIRRLHIRTPGTLTITFIGPQRMRRLNKRFLGHDWSTDVLSFRYDGVESRSGGCAGVVGDLLIAPSLARAYAKQHGTSFTQELSRYVVHGLLHWIGHDDRTAAQQRAMRAREDRLLATLATYGD